MRNFKNFILLSSLFILQHSYGQIVDIEKIINDDKFVKMENLGIQLYTSDNYEKGIKMDKQLIEYFPDSFFQEVAVFDEWIKENLSKTKFTNLQEAVDFYNNYRLIKRENDIKLKEILRIQDQLSQEYGAENISYLYNERILSKAYHINKSKK